MLLLLWIVLQLWMTYLSFSRDEVEWCITVNIATYWYCTTKYAGLYCYCIHCTATENCIDTCRLACYYRGLCCYSGLHTHTPTHKSFAFPSLIQQHNVIIMLLIVTVLSYPTAAPETFSNPFTIYDNLSSIPIHDLRHSQIILPNCHLCQTIWTKPRSKQTLQQLDEKFWPPPIQLTVLIIQSEWGGHVEHKLME